MKNWMRCATVVSFDAALLFSGGVAGALATGQGWAKVIPGSVSFVVACALALSAAGRYSRWFPQMDQHYRVTRSLQALLFGVVLWSVFLLNFDANRGNLLPYIVTTSLLGAALALLPNIIQRSGDRHQTELAVISQPSVVQAQHDGTAKRILVIGGAGYIGSGLLKKLLAKGYQVRLLDAFMFGEEPIRDILQHPNLEVVKADFRQVDKVVSAMQGVDTVVHLGAIVGDPACAIDEDYTIEVNLIATRMIAECAKGFGIRKFVFASTCSVYGASDELLDESSDLNPVSLYARSKIACEKILHEMQSESFRPTILRFGTVFGLSGRTRFDLVVNLLTAKAVVDRKITVFGEDQWRPFVHVDDASLAVATVVEAPLDVVGGETYNVGSNSGNYTLGQVARLINGYVPQAELVLSGSDGDRRNYQVNFGKIQSELGFEAAWSLEAGVKQVIAAFERGDVMDYEAAQYSNVKLLHAEMASKGLQTEQKRLKNLVEEAA